MVADFDLTRNLTILIKMLSAVSLQMTGALDSFFKLQLYSKNPRAKN